MGCALSKTQDEHATLSTTLGEVYVFFPGLRLPRKVDFGNSLVREHYSSALIGRLAALRSKVVAAAENACKIAKANNKASETSSIYELRSALENYLSALQGMTTTEALGEEGSLSNCLEFCWSNQEDEIKESVVPSVYYELLSVLHLLAMLSLLEANLTLTPKPSSEDQRLRPNDGRKAAVEMLLEAARILDYCIERVYPNVPEDLKTKFPADVQEELLKSLQLQALGQTLEIQLGLAIDNLKATLAVKRRIACEAVKYWQMAFEGLQRVRLQNNWGEKHVLFLKWKRASAKAAAYYYHGLVLEEGPDKSKAAASLQAAEAFLAESRTLCRDFSAASPVTKKSPVWGAMKSLSQKIPDAASRAGITTTKGVSQKHSCYQTASFRSSQISPSLCSGMFTSSQRLTRYGRRREASLQGQTSARALALSIKQAIEGEEEKVKRTDVDEEIE
ncbi:BRO1 domain-containing protein BROX isoform X1 [Selaginella moellendorffii]|uniref:BRO1 domain-containing protein BROX isoform X1 n=1 Tax=Selaginella moellendorffii TaxID=88036 RepID=UPI000D1C709A|nr:BRO1 domain-containing protein BROX isoform X1 [Selaginella moellendorffii]|eukprot:XP_024522643.1 BRO1 domain-containing protein BROX isoform X1 [Selaginella moellendorffii]